MSSNDVEDINVADSEQSAYYWKLEHHDPVKAVLLYSGVAIIVIFVGVAVVMWRKFQRNRSNASSDVEHYALHSMQNSTAQH